MNPLSHYLTLAACAICTAVQTIASEPVRLFYDVGAITHEITEFEGWRPVLDTPVDSATERSQFDGPWSFFGELPMGSRYMAPVFPYRLQRVPRNYTTQSDPPAHRVYAGEGSASVIGYEKLESEYADGVLVFGWLVGERVSGIVVTPVNAVSVMELTLKGPGIEPDGSMVYWLLDSEGRPVALPERSFSIEEELRLAALNGDLDALRGLLEGDPKRIENVDDFGRSLLEYAVLGGRVHVVEFLIEQGIDPSIENQANASALDIAAESGWLEIVKLIATDKPRKTKQKIQYSIAAANAFNEHHEEIAIHLLELGAKVDLDKSNAGERALGLYANRNVALARWVTERFKVKGSYSKSGSNFLHAVAPYADTALLESLSAAGASVNQLSENGVSPLLAACGVGNREAICWFMENGGRPGEEEALDPMMYAVRKRVQESVSCLIDYGVSVNREMKAGISPLMMACSLGEKAIAEMLLDAGAVWIFDSKYHDTSLRELIRMDSVHLLEGLFDQGLARDHRLFGRARMIEIAQFFESTDVVSVLREAEGGAEPELLGTSELETKPKILRRTDVEYPFELEEKYGNVDVSLKLGISGDGATVAIKVDDSVPSDLAAFVERSLHSWQFEPLELGSEDAIAIVNFKLPLRASFDENEVFSLNRVSELPRAVRQVDPSYPLRMKELGLAGRVTLQWIIDSQGRVRKPEVVKSSSAAFEAPALEAIEQSRWIPAKMNGVPVAVSVIQELVFNP